MKMNMDKQAATHFKLNEAGCHEGNRLRRAQPHRRIPRPVFVVYPESDLIDPDYYQYSNSGHHDRYQGDGISYLGPGRCKSIRLLAFSPSNTSNRSLNLWQGPPVMRSN